MPTPNLNLPLIDRNMFADVPRDMNALAYAVDDAVGPDGKIALRQDLVLIQQNLNNHSTDTVKHVTQAEREGWNVAFAHTSDNAKHITSAERTIWNKAVTDIGDTTQLKTQNKEKLVFAMNELFTLSVDKNTKVASAITDMGVPTAADATGDVMAANIRNLGNTVIGSGALVRNGTSVRVSGTTPNMIPSAIIVYYNNTANRGRTVHWAGVGNDETVSYMLDGVSTINYYPSTINKWHGGFTIDIQHPNASGGYSYIAVK